MASRGGDAESLEDQIREVLTALEMLSNGRVLDPGSRGGDQDDILPALSIGDAPHLYWQERWETACEDVLEGARDALDAILHSRADFGANETLRDLCQRIVEELEGLTLQEAAYRARTSKLIVRHARRDAGREEEYGQPPKDVSSLSREQRQRLVRSLAERRSAPSIARALGLSVTTVRRDLGRRSFELRDPPPDFKG